VEVPALIPAEVVPTVEEKPPPPKPEPKHDPINEDEEEAKPRKIHKPELIDEDEEESEDDRQSRSKRRRDDEEAPPRKKRRRQDDDYEYDRRPRRKRRKNGGGMAAVVIIGVIFGGLLLLGGLGYGIYAIVSKNSPPPSGWKEFTYKDYGFKAYFPKEPIVEKGRPDEFARVDFGGLGDTWRDSIVSGAIFHSGTNDDPVHAVVVVFRCKPGREAQQKIESELRKSVERSASKRNSEIRTVRWLGQQADEVVTSEGVMRLVYTDSAVYTALIRGKGKTRATSAEEHGFFDNMELLK